MRFTFALLAGIAACVNAPAELPRLQVQGTEIVDPGGRVVSMRGANFGGWLMMETWIPSIELEWHDHLPRLAAECGILEAYRDAEKTVGAFDDDTMHIRDYIERLHAALASAIGPDRFAPYAALVDAEPSVFAAHDMDVLLRKRFGDFGAGRIWNAYHDTWITETDFQLAKAMGFNFVRIPFWYRWFENDDVPGEFHNYGLRYLERAVDWAEKHGLYVMLDLHAAPGGQNPWDHSGELSRGEFFKRPDFQQRAADLWRHLAAHFRNRPAIWAYDLLNEPFSADDVSDWTAAHDLIYDAIREVDPETIVIMEDGYKLEFDRWMHTGFFPKPDERGWTNVIYSFHFYSGADPLFTTDAGLADHAKRLEEVERIGRMEQSRCNVPIYIGEFSTMGDRPNDIAGMRLFLTRFNELGWAWSPWTWKYVNDDEEGSIWGIWQYAHPWPGTPNLYRASMEEILAAIDRLHMRDFRLKDDYAAVLRACLAQ